MSDAKILIVEDEAIEAMDIQQRLARLGYPLPAVANSGEEGVRKVDEIHPDLVLMDIMMPGKMDGIAAAKEIRSRFDIPIIFLTAYADEETLGRAKATGPHGYIVKPFQERELHITIDMALSKHRLESELLRSEARFRSLVESSADFVWEVNAQGAYTYVSPRVKDLLGYEPEEVLGRKPFDLMPEGEAARLGQRFDSAITARKSIVNLENRNRHKDGRIVVLETNGIPFFDQAGELAGYRGIDRDITERKQAEEELLRYRDHLEEMIKERTTALERQFWIRDGQNRLGERMSGGLAVGPLANEIVAAVAEHIKAQVGALFLAQDGHLKLTGRYAYQTCAGVPDVFGLGEGLVGQAAASGKPILLSDVPTDYVLVGSGLGQTPPRYILALPFRFGSDVTGVIELASLEPFSELQREFLDRVMVAVGIAIQTARANERTRELLVESQQQAEELQAQQEELRVANEELEVQTQRLFQSEEKLKAQQEELEISNEELEEKNEQLERRKFELERARNDLAERAEELAQASKYKSEFLANMSHELRTPLNSLLLLAKSLARNKDGNLTTEQVESAGIIHDSGSELLRLINEILDLSKIEAGRMELHCVPVNVSDLADGVRTTFGHLAGDKGLTLEVIVRDDAPAEIVSDRLRIDQVLRNLLSNAIKFTEKGSVVVTFSADQSQIGNRQLAIAVTDTGIGIATEHRERIFEAFRQAEGGTARKYGGTGLGLSIARELTRLLGGRIEFLSEQGKGSTFTLIHPVKPLPKVDARPPEVSGVGSKPSHEPALHYEPVTSLPQHAIDDDRGNLEPDDRVILIIEDDAAFAGILRGQCRDRGLKCLVSPTGEAGLELAAHHQPAGVMLDIRLPGMDGWAVLATLKENILTRHIPVHILSVVNAPAEARRKGAIGFTLKPLSQEDIDTAFQRLEQVATDKPKRVLVVEDDTEMRHRIVTLIGNGDVKVDEAATGAEALEVLRVGRCDCLVLDLALPDMDGDELLAILQREGIELPPVVIHTARSLTEDEERVLREHAESIVIKDTRSQERLLDEVSLFLHRVVSRMPERQRKAIASLYDSDALLRDKTVLVVDDDMRTTFAVSRLLAEHGMKPLKAENGERALRLLAEHDEVDLVLMDIMMPVMDGYETMRRIRDPKSPVRNHKVPIIVLTAKAMPEDRSKCLAAGADDYLAKPLDEARLLSMLRVWMYR